MCTCFFACVLVYLVFQTFEFLKVENLSTHVHKCVVICVSDFERYTMAKLLIFKCFLYTLCTVYLNVYY